MNIDGKAARQASSSSDDQRASQNAKVGTKVQATANVKMFCSNALKPAFVWAKKNVIIKKMGVLSGNPEDSDCE